MIHFLVIVSVLAGLAGLAFLSQATLGAGLICFAILLAVLARIAQAAAHAAALKSELWAIHRTAQDANKGPLSGQ